MTDKKAALSDLHKNLNILQEREAKYGGNAPIELLNQIEDHKKAINLTEQVIAGDLTEAEYFEVLKPLLLAVKNGQVVNIEAVNYIAGDMKGDIVYGLKIIVNQAPFSLEQPSDFASLPLDRIPDLASLPRGSRMLLSHNPLFVGRNDDLRALAVALKGDKTVAMGQIAVITGLGGIGKTQLATEFVHRYGQYFNGGVFWLDFAEPANVPGEVAACGRLNAMNLQDFYSLSLDEQARRVFQEWQSPDPRLLVFDNCEDEKLLDQWRPKTGGCRVLVTSRRRTWELSLGVKVLALDVLLRGESIALLRKFYADLNISEADVISTELGDLPLALHLAGRFLSRYRHTVTPKAYLDHLHSSALLQHRSLLDDGISPTGHIQQVGRTFALSYERLDISDSTDTLAIELLIRVANFVPGESIPRELLKATTTLDNIDGDLSMQFEDAVARLIELGLLEDRIEGALRMHRLVAMFVQQNSEDNKTQVYDDVIKILGDLKFIERIAKLYKRKEYIQQFFQSCLNSMTVEQIRRSAKLINMEAAPQHFAACLELFYVLSCGALDKDAFCTLCKENTIIHGYIDLGGDSPYFWDNYFSWCINCFWSWYYDDVQTAGLEMLPLSFDLNTNTYK